MLSTEAKSQNCIKNSTLNESPGYSFELSEECLETTSDITFAASITKTESKTGLLSIIGPESEAVFVNVV